MRCHLANSLMIMTLAMIALAFFKPASAYAWWNGDWTARKLITIDTSAAGGSITDPIGATPVLIRLDVSNLVFDNANADGSDLRFVAADDKTLLPYHIEKYDNLLGQAFVWVNVPDLKPGAQTMLYLYYGNKKATAADDSKATFDASTVLVYHFGDKGAPAKDWSGNGNNASTAGQQDDFALIGPGLRLNGQTPVTLPATPTLAWAGGNALTWSLWVNETALQPNAVLYSRTDGTSTVQIGVDNGAPFVSVTNASGTQRTAAGAAISAASWHHIAVVASAQQLTLYVDGASYATLNTPLPALNSIAYLGGDATTGTAAAAGSAATPAPATPAPATQAPATAAPAAAPAAATIGFIGSIDELDISNIARPAGFIKFAAISQGSDPLAAKLISYGTEEKPASWFSGPFVVILGSVTLDGWVVIGILALMAIVSWVVMADKIAYVNRTAKANETFSERFSHMAYDLTAIDQAAPAGGVKALEASPMYHMYNIGAQELRLRFPGSVTPESKILSAQSIAAIRSALDTSLVRETQKLNKSMVLLTIAIAGGPFLGLLGTVVGVMITFATIAASGDVNVTAIAPGISAALVATVAGLVVAIPALFGYNYLNSRISEEVSDMQVFADEFVTKMAEYYSPRIIPSVAE